MILYNLLSAYKRVGLPEEFHTARPKRLRFCGSLKRSERYRSLNFRLSPTQAQAAVLTSLHIFVKINRASLPDARCLS